MLRLAGLLRSEGRAVYPLNFTPNWGQVGIETLAEQFKSNLDAILPADQILDFVAFSMGGLVVRYYLQRLGGLKRAGRLVTISTPHRGSLLAWMLPNPGGRQMRPNSPFLRDLERDENRLQSLGFTSLWTPLDLMVFPATSSVVPSARNWKIWCVAHPLMVLESRCLRAASLALRD